MNARERWQALQARLTAARAFESAGDNGSALREVEAALALDPNFLAAHSLRERLLGAPMRPIPPPPPEPRAIEADPGAGYAMFEQRARRRRVDRKIESARSAIASGRLREAASALDEIIELDPNLPELAPLTAQFDDLRRGAPEHRTGPFVVAAAAFAVVLGATWIEQARPNLFARSSTAVAALVEPAPPQPVPSEPSGVDTLEPPEPSPSVVTTASTTGVRENEPARPALVERDRPVRNVEPRTEAAIPPVAGSLDATLGSRPAATLPSPEPVNVPPPAPAMQPPPRQTPEPIVIPPAAQPPSSAPAASPVAAAVMRSANDEQLVRQALQRYRSAFDGLDAPSARAVYPAVNEAALARAFGGLESQTLTFDNCDVQMRGDAASAICSGTARYVPKVGSREPRIEPRRWTFTLRRSGTDWKIDNARAER